MAANIWDARRKEAPNHTDGVAPTLTARQKKKKPNRNNYRVKDTLQYKELTVLMLLCLNAEYRVSPRGGDGETQGRDTSGGERGF